MSRHSIRTALSHRICRTRCALAPTDKSRISRFAHAWAIRSVLIGERTIILIIANPTLLVSAVIEDGWVDRADYSAHDHHRKWPGNQHAVPLLIFPTPAASHTHRTAACVIKADRRQPQGLALTPAQTGTLILAGATSTQITCAMPRGKRRLISALLAVKWLLGSISWIRSVSLRIRSAPLA